MADVSVIFITSQVLTVGGSNVSNVQPLSREANPIPIKIRRIVVFMCSAILQEIKFQIIKVKMMVTTNQMYINILDTIQNSIKKHCCPVNPDN